MNQRANKHDSLTLLARDLRPIVWICGVWKIFVFLELLMNGFQQVIQTNTFQTSID